jgi:hypothetical protein
VSGSVTHVDIVFRYLPALNIVTVEVRSLAYHAGFSPMGSGTAGVINCELLQAKGHGNLLTSLLPGDKGLESPRASNYFDVEFGAWV